MPGATFPTFKRPSRPLSISKLRQSPSQAPAPRILRRFRTASRPKQRPVAFGADVGSGDLDVRVGGGPTLVRDFFAADLIDVAHLVREALAGPA